MRTNLLGICYELLQNNKLNFNKELNRGDIDITEL